jgi:hypothetical protein
LNPEISNQDRFPAEFLFQLTADEASDVPRLRPQIVTLKAGRGHHRKYLPLALTEHGARVGTGRNGLVAEREPRRRTPTRASSSPAASNSPARIPGIPPLFFAATPRNFA